ncbi:MAG: tRNA (adenosine(37)-N6)-threonylcarbamoyltransferase complex ATPase subunit type 1 TsaE [Armatimonadota bacterium]
MSCSTRSAAETQALGEALGSLLAPGDIVAVTGPLGAGKTCFIQGLARGAGVTDNVTSPTFIIHRQHPGPVPFHHIDAYRLRDGGGLLEAVGPELFSETGIVAVEWADRVADALPSDRLTVDIQYTESGRSVCLQANGPRAHDILEQLELPDDSGH